MKSALLTLILTLSSGALSKLESRTRFSRYGSWNSQMYPVWNDGDPRYKDCWKGGEVAFEVKSDSPTLTGAKATFNIDVSFPVNQTVLPDGQVVWARNCTINGTAYTMGQAVYPESNFLQEWTGVFPDGTPFTKISNRKPRFIYVWKTWGKYWQVADGPSSLLTLGTENVPLGSYNMEVVIYHCRGKNRFIPLGYASTQFSITDQIPFTVMLSQLGDINQGDQNFIQNRAVSFSINLHDPSHYLSGSDVTFTWDFGDNSGTLISRETSVTHTYLAIGSFRPQVVVMAAISAGCQPNPTISPSIIPPAPTTGVVAPSVSPDEVMAMSSEAAAVENIGLAVSPQPDNIVPMTEEVMTVDATAAANDLAVAESITAAETDNEAAQDVPTIAVNTAVDESNDITEIAVNTPADVEVEPAAELPIPASVETAAEGEVVVISLAATVPPESTAPIADTTAVQTVIEVIVPTGDTENIIATEAPVSDAVASVVPATEDTEAVNEINPVVNAEAEATAVPGVTAVAETEVNELAAELEVEATQATLAIAKRQAPEMPAETNCMIYRYGSFSTTLDVVQGIESVEIVEVNNVVTLATEMGQNAVDLTVMCQGSLPSEACIVVSDADCASPVQTLCNAVTPTPECQMVLRQFFNDSGTFCINVSLTNDVSLAVTSARVSVTIGTNSLRNTAGAALGVLVFVCALGAIAFSYKRLKDYLPLREDNTSINLGSGKTSLSLMLWSLLSHQSAGESRPLLQGRVV